MSSDIGSSREWDLLWPAALFAEEANALLGLSNAANFYWPRAVKLLLQEAFADDAPLTRFDGATRQDLSPPFTAASLGGGHAHAFLDNLALAAHRLNVRPLPRPYWPAGGVADLGAATIDDLDLLGEQWGNLVEELVAQGYFDRAAEADGLLDAAEDQQVMQALERQVSRRLRRPGLRLRDVAGDGGDRFYGVVEVVHDLAARPRDRRESEAVGGRWRYQMFARGPGQALYRWRVNDLLARYGVGLRLAEDGEDAGRLVRVTGDGREELVQEALVTPAALDRSAVEHAVAQFRARGAGREDKRSAVVTLARVLEDRRVLLKQELFRKDEGALFHIANEFDLRHRGATQHEDYDEAFLDWVFWWYLATLELTDQLLARQAST